MSIKSFQEGSFLKMSFHIFFVVQGELFAFHWGGGEVNVLPPAVYIFIWKGIGFNIYIALAADVVLCFMFYGSYTYYLNQLSSIVFI